MNAMTTEYASHNSDGSESETDEKYKSDQEEGDSDETLNVKNEESNSDYEEDNYNLGALPLEVITTVEPTNYAYPILKNMSNGVLTHRNIFTESERLVLKDIINKYRNIVDTRSRTREIYLEKQNVWQQIVEEYNSAENIMVRTEKELRKCWDNMKYRAKQACIKKQGKTDDDICNNMQDFESITENSLQEAENQMKALINNGNIKEESEESLYGRDCSTNIHPHLISIKQDSLSDHEENHQSIGEREFLDKDSNCEDGEPELKRARQESPKLSSLLLAGPKKTKEKKSNISNLDKTGNFSFNIPPCTKIYNVKKSKSNTPIGVPILPKGLSSCLSITNIPNPYPYISTSLPSNTLSETTSNSFNSSNLDINGQIKPMPSLKKMLLNKNIAQSVGCKTHKSNNKNMSLNLDNDINFSNGFGNTNILNSSKHGVLNGSCSNGEEDFEQSFTLRLMNQRLKFERLEHEAKMKLHEKQMQVKNYEAQYWALKLKLLRAGKDPNNCMNVSSCDLNGEFH